MWKITIKNLQKRITIHPRVIKRAVLKALSQESPGKSGEITVCFVSDKEIKRLNARYLNKNSPTDVIAFDITGSFGGPLMADIVVSTDRAFANAGFFKTDPFYELCLYAVHGALHLSGYDDGNWRQRKAMDAKAQRILDTLGIKKITG